MSELSLHQVLPHKPPMVLLTDFINSDNESARCLVVISEASAFFDREQQGVPAYVGIEYMAQTVAAYSGALSQRSGGKPNIGFLLGTRKYQVDVAHFLVGERFEIAVEKVVEDASGLSVFACKIMNFKTSQVVAKAKLSVFQPKNATAWLQEKA